MRSASRHLPHLAVVAIVVINSMNQNSSITNAAVRFMFVDDDEICIMALERGMKQLEISNPVEVAKDGIEALEILREAVGVDGILPPYVVLLDLNMPKMGGLEFLKTIRSDGALKKLIVFVFTTSDTPSDIASAYAHNVAGYIVKKDQSNIYKNALATIKGYSELVVLPS